MENCDMSIYNQPSKSTSGTKESGFVAGKIQQNSSGDRVDNKKDSTANLLSVGNNEKKLAASLLIVLSFHHNLNTIIIFLKGHS